jgi:hypothetical protein
MTKKNTILFVIATVFTASISRLMPHPFNFTPIIGMSLMAGSVLQNRKLSLLVVLLSMFISDVLTIHFINFNYSTYIGYFSSLSAISVYVSLVFIVLFSEKVKNFKPSLKLAFIGLSSGLFFWIITNLGVWLSGSLPYPISIEGFTACFAAAIPFLSNQLIGDVLFTTIFAGIFIAFQNLKFLKTQKV